LIAILSLKKAYKEKLKILTPLNISFNLFGLSLLILFGLVLLTLNFFIYQYSSFTLMILTAVIISILYIEMGIILSRNFFSKFFDDQLPKEIIYFIGFILMINAGYFTIMFILKIIKANSLI
jgi:divalent metal cation (Fe/Co/Zn/Cd) transporter